MRRISKNIDDILRNQLQTEANRSKLTSIVELKRPYTVLKNDYFLEKLQLDFGTKKEIERFLYDRGNKCTEFSGGWGKHDFDSSFTGGYYKENADCISFGDSSGWHYNRACARSGKAIDVTNARTMFITYSITDQAGTISAALHLCRQSNYDVRGDMSSVKSFKLTVSGTVEITMEFDISDVDGEVWIYPIVSSGSYMQHKAIMNLYSISMLTFDNDKLSDVDIAVSHPRLAHPNDEIYLTDVRNGVGRVYVSKSQHIMENHKFVSLGYEVPATKVSIGFENMFEPNYRYQQERITGWTPWWFYVTPEGALIGKHIDTEEEITIATDSVSDVSVVSGPWHWSTDFDYGMIVFFIVNGLLMCRGYIKETWYNAEVINFGPGGPYSSVTATLTWDYRIAITVSDSGNNSNILFTNFLGFGKFVSETVELGGSNVVKATLFGREYKNMYMTESVHIKANSSTSAKMIPKGPSLPIKVENIKSTNVEWGRVIRVTFNHPIIADQFDVNGAFSLVDEMGCETSQYHGGVRNVDGTIDLTFDGFNNYVGICTLEYMPGKMKNEFGYFVDPFTFDFEPGHLNGNNVPYHYETLEIKANASVIANVMDIKKPNTYISDTVHLKADSQISAIVIHKDDI